MPRGGGVRVRPPWGVDEPSFRAAGQGLGREAMSESQRVALVAKAPEPKPPAYPRCDVRIDKVNERNQTNSRFTRRSLVWYDTENGNASGEANRRLPSLSARAAQKLATPPKPFWSARGTAAAARQPTDAHGRGAPRHVISGYTGFKPRADVAHTDPLRYKAPTDITERAAMTGVQRGVCGYRGFIPRNLRDKAVALPIGAQPMESGDHSQRWKMTSDRSTPPPPLPPNVRSRAIEPPVPARVPLNGVPEPLQPLPRQHARGYTGCVARATKDQLKRNDAGVSEIQNPTYRERRSLLPSS